MLQLPAEMRYSCLQCGRSCHIFDEIELDAESIDRLARIEATELLPPTLPLADPWVPGLVDPRKRILPRVDGHCGFLRDDCNCSIHEKHGGAAKPQTCQDFPFRYVETPGAIHVGLSFACTAVQQNHGMALEEQRAHLEHQAAVSLSRRRLSEPPSLTNRHRLSWEAYDLVQEDLAGILGQRALPLELRLVAQSAYLDLLAAFLREVRGDRPLQTKPDSSKAGCFEPDTVQRDVDVVAALRRQFLTGNQDAPIFRLARKFRGSPVLQRAFIGLITGFRQSLMASARPGRLAGTAAILGHYLRHAARIGRVHLMPLKGRFDFRDFSRIRFSDAAEPELFRYYSHTLFRQDLLLAGNIWIGHRLMLMHHALIRWHAVGTAALTAEDEVHETALRTALGIVDQYYAFHTPFRKFFEDFPVMGMILDAIVRRPVYAASMVISPMKERA
jgi:Fe-S-cluster containining protein